MSTKHWGWAGLMLGAVLAAAGCGGKERKFVSGDGEPSQTGDGFIIGAAGGPAEGPPEEREGPAEGQMGGGDFTANVPATNEGTLLAVLGATCASNAECASAFCVDGVCCETSCGELCATCAAPGSVGTCAPAASDPACDELGCAGGTECRGYDQTQLELNCEALGQCRSGIECASLDQAEGTTCQSGTGACDGAGQCLVPGKALLGASCEADDDCGEGHCVVRDDGSAICCDSACDGVCQQCSDAGRCDEAPVTDERCSSVTCPSDNACRDYQDGITTNLCRSFGQCKSEQDCTFEALRVAAACECDATGLCNLARGQRCSDDAECGLGACEPSVTGETVCCAAACGGGLSCSRDGLGCVECEGTSIQCDGNIEQRCDGGSSISSNCQNGCTPGAGCNALAPVGFQCDTVACQADGVCQTDITGARRCCSRDCAAEGKVCAENGSCVCPEGQTTGAGSSCLLQQGDPCGPGTPACEAGLSCVDGVCCAGACGAACESCNVQGRAGECVFNAQDTSGCGTGEQCVARGDCRLNLGESCGGADASCISNNCEPLLGVNGASVCCAQTCNAQRPFCSRDGARCVECEGNTGCLNGCENGLCRPLRELGELCANPSQCDSGVCTLISGTNTRRCCGQCDGGQVCNAAGGCECPPNQVLLGGQCRRLDGQECSQRFECANNNCEAAIDGRSRCCADDCAAGTELCAQNGSACVDQRGGVGATCSRATDCQTGNCVDGFCCDGPCSNVCERCNAPGQAGRCVEDPSDLSCGGGRECFGRNRCLAPSGGICSAATPCGDATCTPLESNNDALICCAQACGARTPFCTDDGRSCIQCDSDSDSVCGNGCDLSTNTCRPGRADGLACTSGSECASGVCSQQFPDADRDRFPSATGGIQVCGNTLQTRGDVRYILARTDGSVDCCDSDSRAFPGATVAQSTPTPAGCGGGGFDFNCSGASTTLPERLWNCNDTSISQCSRRGGWLLPNQGSTAAHPDGIPPRCGDSGYALGCVASAEGCVSTFLGGVASRACL